MGKVSLKEYAATEKETTLSLLAISVLGLIISYAYDSNLYKFWLFIMALQLIDLCMQRKENDSTERNAIHQQLAERQT